MKIPSFTLGQVPAIPVFLLLMLSLAAGCSSDGDGDVVSLPGTVPDQLNYKIRQGTGAQLILTQNPTATVSSTLLTGTFNRITQAFTLNVQPAAAMVVTDNTFVDTLNTELSNHIGEVVDFSNYSLHVTSAVAWVGDDDPTSGEIDIRDDPDPVRKITVRVITDAGGQGTPGVEITLVPANSSTQSVQYTWAELDGLLENQSAEAYAKIAAIAYSMLRFMYEQGELVILALEFLDENDLLLEQSASIIEDCDTYPPLLPPDQVVANPGDSLISWTDASFDGELGPGDNFLLNFTQCWDDDETDDIDRLFHGSVNFVNYTEAQSGGVITRIGFEPSNGPGGIDFTGLQITETETTQTNVVLAIDETITLTGGFSMVFTSP